MTTLVPIDGSQSSLEAVRYAARRRPSGRLVLLYVAPSARHAELERGRFLLAESLRACRDVAASVKAETRLEIGDRRAMLPEVVEEAGADLVVMGAHGLNALPHLEPVSCEASSLSEDLHSPVVLVLPTGRGIPAEADDSCWDEEEALFPTGAPGAEPPD